MTVLSTNRIISLLNDNCKSRLSCRGCTMSGKYSLRDTCLLKVLKDTTSGKQLTMRDIERDNMIGIIGTALRQGGLL